jgi:hypothetical protein
VFTTKPERVLAVQVRACWLFQSLIVTDQPDRNFSADANELRKGSSFCLLSRGHHAAVQVPGVTKRVVRIKEVHAGERTSRSQASYATLHSQAPR